MKPKQRIFLQLFCLLSTLLLSGSCSLNYSDAEMAEDLSEELPNSIIRSYRFVDIRSGRSSFQIYAAEARMYHKARKTQLKELFFQEINPEGEVVTEGEAARATIFTQTDDVEMHGDISFSGAAQEATIMSDYLYWNNEERRLEGNPEQTVTIIKADGTRIHGKGFSAEAAGQRVEFSEAVEGIYVQTAEDDEGNENAE
ncbi:MAG: LPS export ABC transporter periplasmic protein LptC [Spirochaetia bacterium]